MEHSMISKPVCELNIEELFVFRNHLNYSCSPIQAFIRAEAAHLVPVIGICRSKSPSNMPRTQSSVESTYVIRLTSSLNETSAAEQIA